MGLIEINFAREMKFIQMMEEAEAAKKRRRTGGREKRKKLETNPMMLDHLVFVLVLQT